MERLIDRAPVIVFSMTLIALFVWLGIPIRRATFYVGLLWATALASFLIR